jgi:23S rRNA (cytidine1920-2'-O)/16S rRNA (cytidine1409-2'-O)-methyltransferase
MGKRQRLDRLLVDRGLVTSREEGRARILAGEVFVREQSCAKAGTLVDAHAEIRLKPKASPYASRGGSKLEKALREFSVEVKDKIALDVGASTGGFTDCLLRHGARLVYAVDVGYGQLAWNLRNDARVRVFEKTNIRYLDVSALPGPADLATVDVSFISLRLVLPNIKTLLRPDHEIVALIKPQFEVGKGKVGKGGVVRSADEHARVIEEIAGAAAALGFRVQAVTESPLLGPAGNKEFFMHLKHAESSA